MSLNLRPLTTGELLDKAFQTYRQHFILFVGISALPQGCLLVLQLCMLAVGGKPGVITPGKIGLTLFFSLMVLIISIVMSSIALAATTFGVSDIYLEKETSISACFARVKGKIGKVAWVSFKFGLAVGIGIVLLVIPGIYVAGKYGLATPAVVLEDIKSSQAFKRSAQLTEGSIGRIITIYFIATILVLVISTGIGALLAALYPSLAKSAGTTASQVFQQVISAVANTLVTPVTAIALTLAYYDQRVRKEAFDIESMMSLLGEAAPVQANQLGAVQ